MSKTALYAAALVAGFAGVVTGFAVTSMAADSKVDPATLTAARIGITAYEPDSQTGGGGAPQKLLLDNDVVRVNLVSFPKDFVRPGKLKRRYDQLLVYIDQSDFTLTWSGGRGEPYKPSEMKASKLEPGSVAWHPRESLVSESHINNAYRVIFVEMKKK